MIRLATVGTSGICQQFLDGMALTGEFKLTAVYSRTAQKGEEFALKNNCLKVYTDLNEMAKDKGIDAVYIASPNAFHYKQSRIFLENGKHVICEKPITSSLSEYKELKALADSKGLIYMEAIMSRHNRSREKLLSAMEKIGDIRMARIDFNQRSSRLDSFLKGEKVNIFDMSLKAGTLMDLGIYCVYAAVDMFGIPKAITARSNFFQNGADCSGCAIFDYGDFSAVLTYGKNGQGCIGSEIIGDKGAVKISLVSLYQGISLFKDGKNTDLTKELSKAYIMSCEARSFANYILKFKEYKEEYSQVSALCADVHYCMDKIKQSAGIVYPDLKTKGV